MGKMGKGCFLLEADGVMLQKHLVFIGRDHRHDPMLAIDDAELDRNLDVEKRSEGDDDLMKHHVRIGKETKAMLCAEDIDVRMIAERLIGQIMENNHNSFAQCQTIGNNNVQALASLDKVFFRGDATLHSRKMKIKFLTLLAKNVVVKHRIRRGKVRTEHGVLRALVKIQAVKCGNDWSRCCVLHLERARIQPRNIQNIELGGSDKMLHLNAAIVVRKRDQRLAERSAKHKQRHLCKNRLVALKKNSWD